MHSGALIDAHVHFYSSYDVRRFLDAASASFAEHPQHSARRVLCMAESASDNWFGNVSTDPGVLANSGWTLHHTGEPQSIRLRREADDAELIVIAGHQCVAREDIEVLILGQLDKHPDGQPAADIVQAALDKGALPLLPWGFGKWLGQRGTLVAQLMERFGKQLLLGDNSGRLAHTSLPGLLRQGEQQGHCLLPGSDPLPMRGEEHKVASFGAFLSGDLSNEMPFDSLKLMLADSADPQPYGAGETLGRFIRNQFLMQIRKRLAARA